jgi:hypothetical protein
VANHETYLGVQQLKNTGEIAMSDSAAIKDAKKYLLVTYTNVSAGSMSSTDIAFSCSTPRRMRAPRSTNTSWISGGEDSLDDDFERCCLYYYIGAELAVKCIGWHQISEAQNNALDDLGLA